ncbi:MAG: hypothetical protein ABEH81_04195 [Halopenitus sp.]
MSVRTQRWTVNIYELGFDVEPGTERQVEVDVNRGREETVVALERGREEYELRFQGGRLVERVPAPPISLPRWVPAVLERAGVDLQKNPSDR